MRRWARNGRRCARCAASSPARSSSSAPRSASAPACRPPRTSMPRPEYLAAMKGLDLAEICITSGGELVEGEGPAGAFTLPDVPRASRRRSGCWPAGNKCARCWQVLEEVGKSARPSAALPALRRSGGSANSMRADRPPGDGPGRRHPGGRPGVQAAPAGLPDEGRRHRAGDRRVLPAGDRVEPRRQLRPAGRRPRAAALGPVGGRGGGLHRAVRVAATNRPGASPAGASALSWGALSAMLSTAPGGERCSISPISTWANGIGRRSTSPIRRSLWASG